MANQIQVILSDSDDDDYYKTPLTKKRPTRPGPTNILTIDDDTPQSLKLPRKTVLSDDPPSYVPETPLSHLPRHISRCTVTAPDPTPSSSTLPRVGELIPVESDDDSEGGLGRGTSWKNVGTSVGFDVGVDLECSPSFTAKQKHLGDGASPSDLDADKWLCKSPRLIGSTSYLNNVVQSNGYDNDAEDIGETSYLKGDGTFADFDTEQDMEKSPKYVITENGVEYGGILVDSDVECLERSPQIAGSTRFLGSLDSTKSDDCTYLNDDDILMLPFHNQDNGKHNVGLEEEGVIHEQKKVVKFSAKKKQKEGQAVNKKKSKEEKMQLMEEKKRKKEEDKLLKAALKDETAMIKKMEKEKQKTEKEKQKMETILAVIDPKVVELGKIGGHLLTSFRETKLDYKVTPNPIEKSILWRMAVPKEMAQLTPVTTHIAYVLLVYEAEEFCELVNGGSLMDHISSVQAHYPSYTICCLTNRLMSYINKREQDHFKNRNNAKDWKRPPVEEALAKLTTQFANVRYRQCVDEAEVAEHIVGLTKNLVKCRSRKKLTHLSVNANGSNVPKGCVDRALILKHPWLKALVSIPKVQPRFAIAIQKKYPSMKSLLSVYLDPNKSVHDKELLLKDLPTEGVLGNDDRRLGEICSKRMYRILMAQNGNIKTDDVENGADFFTQQ